MRLLTILSSILTLSYCTNASEEVCQIMNKLDIVADSLEAALSLSDAKDCLSTVARVFMAYPELTLEHAVEGNQPFCSFLGTLDYFELAWLKKRLPGYITNFARIVKSCGSTAFDGLSDHDLFVFNVLLLPINSRDIFLLEMGSGTKNSVRLGCTCSIALETAIVFGASIDNLSEAANFFFFEPTDTFLAMTKELHGKEYADRVLEICKKSNVEFKAFQSLALGDYQSVKLAIQDGCSWKARRDVIFLSACIRQADNLTEFDDGIICEELIDLISFILSSASSESLQQVYENGDIPSDFKSDEFGAAVLPLYVTSGINLAEQKLNGSFLPMDLLTDRRFKSFNILFDCCKDKLDLYFNYPSPNLGHPETLLEQAAHKGEYDLCLKLLSAGSPTCDFRYLTSNSIVALISSFKYIKNYMLIQQLIGLLPDIHGTISFNLVQAVSEEGLAHPDFEDFSSEQEDQYDGWANSVYDDCYDY